MNAPCRRIGSLFPGGRKSMSPLPSSASAPFWSRMVRLSTFGRDPERDPAREVGLDQAGDHVHRRPLRGQNQVDADRAGLLRQPRERGLDLGLHRHHQVGQLVDDDDDEGQDPLGVDVVGRRLRRGVRRLGADAGERGLGTRRVPERLVVLDLAVEVGHVAGAVDLEQLVAPLHLEHRPLEHRRRVVVVGHHLVAEVRQRVVHRELDHLRVDHQQPEPLRRVAGRSGW